MTGFPTSERGMTVAALLEASDMESVVDFIVDYENGRPFDREGYERVWRELAAMKHTPTNMSCLLDMETPFGGKDPQVAVSGHNKATGEKFGIEYVPWSEWLSMEVEIGAAAMHVPAPEIMGHILAEMTACGYEEDLIQAKRRELYSAVASIRDGDPLPPSGGRLH